MQEPFGEMTTEEKAFWLKTGRKIAAMRKRPRSYYDGRRKKITQDDLAAHLGISRASVANIETGRQRVCLYRAQKIYDFLHCTPGRYDQADDALYLIGEDTYGQ